MLKFIGFIFLVYLCIKFIKMDAITKYFESMLFLIIGMIPACVGLLLFDHSMLSNSDILQSTGMFFWACICLLYTAAFTLLYSMNITLIHPFFWKILSITYVPSKEDWKPTFLQMFLYSIIAGLITWFKNGNFIHFIGNSFIVAISVNILLVISFLMIEKGIKNKL